MLILLIIEIVLFLINPIWGLIGIPVFLLFLFVPASTAKNKNPNKNDLYEDELDWDMDDFVDKH
ncbi:MAG: hypothetical protein K5756_00335 [Clostridiales bacterium]|nr:hypothetical protein [Clostridiales bacterium]